MMQKLASLGPDPTIHLAKLHKDNPLMYSQIMSELPGTLGIGGAKVLHKQVMELVKKESSKSENASGDSENEGSEKSEQSNKGASESSVQEPSESGEQSSLESDEQSIEPLDDQTRQLVERTTGETLGSLESQKRRRKMMMTIEPKLRERLLGKAGKKRKSILRTKYEQREKLKSILKTLANPIQEVPK